MKKSVPFKVITLLVFIATASSRISAQEADTTFNVVIKEDKEKTATGGFGADLAKKSSFVNFNGYITNEFFAQQGKKNTFDNHYFNIFISSQISDRIFVEGQLEYEHGGDEVDIRYAYADYKVSDALVFRTGKFLVPAGLFNEYQYPEYIAKAITRAFVNREISPSAWGEVGIQARGRIKNLSSTVEPFYSVYLVNGLHGASGASIRNMRDNSQDTKNNDKAIGGNIGADIGNYLTATANYYTGTYSDDGELNLSIYGLSLQYVKEKLTIWGEYQAANQDAYNDAADLSQGIISLKKNGWYALVGYKVYKGLEPVLRYDAISLDGVGVATSDRSRMTVGLNYHFSSTCNLKVNYDITKNDGIDIDDNLFGVQFALGF
jgi:Phosphate-selective porin O and P